MLRFYNILWPCMQPWVRCMEIYLSRRVYLRIIMLTTLRHTLYEFKNFQPETNQPMLEQFHGPV